MLLTFSISRNRSFSGEEQELLTRRGLEFCAAER